MEEHVFKAELLVVDVIAVDAPVPVLESRELKFLVELDVLPVLF